MSATSILNHLVIGKEATFNTPVAPNITLPVKPEGGLVTDPKAEGVSDVRAQIAKYNDVVHGVHEHAGDFKLDLMTDVSGNIFLGALGSVTSATKSGETAVYEHNFSETANKPSFTFEQKIGDDIRRYAGVIIASWKLTSDTGNAAIGLEFSTLAASQQSASSTTPAPTTEGRYTFDQVQVKLGGVVTCKVLKIDLEYKNNAEAIATLCETKDPNTIVTGGTELDGTIDLLLDSDGSTELGKVLTNDDVRIDLTFTGESIGTGSNNKLEIGIPTAKYVTGEANFTDESKQLVTLAFKAYSQSGSLFDTFKLTNLTASY